MNSLVLVIESHMMRFLARTFSRILLGLQHSIVENELGIVIFSATFWSFDFKNKSDKAINAPGAVTWVFTVFPSLMLLLLVSLLKFVLNIL